MCEINPIKYQRRNLCEKCYYKAWRNGALEPIPKKTNRKYLTNNLVKKYGADILDDFKMLKKNPAWTLERLGKKHGFSRERARQLFEVVFGKPYTSSSIKKSKMLKKDIGCVNDPRYKYAEYKRNWGNSCKSTRWKSAVTEKMFFDRCEEMGLTIEVPCGSKIDIKINGYWVDVKSCFAQSFTSKGQKTPHRRFGITSEQSKKCDFIACYHGGEKAFFIIPKKEFCGGHGIYISEVNTNWGGSKNRYWEYKNAWHLLEHTRLNRRQP